MRYPQPAYALLWVIVSCGSAPVDATTTADGGFVPPLDGAVGDALDGGALFALGLPDASVDAHADPLVPHPPSGSHRCGHGVLRQTEARAACEAAPTGGPFPVPTRCDAITISGGQWEVWCGSDNLYLWARFADLAPTGTYKECSSDTALILLGGLEEIGSGGGNGLKVTGVPTMFSRTNMSTTAIATFQVNGPPPPAGSASLWLTLGLASGCDGGIFGPLKVMAGATLTWGETDGG